jgi:hypothetical protein
VRANKDAANVVMPKQKCTLGTKNNAFKADLFTVLLSIHVIRYRSCCCWEYESQHMPPPHLAAVKEEKIKVKPTKYYF